MRIVTSTFLRLGAFASTSLLIMEHCFWNLAATDCTNGQQDS
jgi:hypothetical protein